MRTEHIASRNKDVGAKMRLSWLFPLFGALILSACASTPEAEPEQTFVAAQVEATELDAQSLATGECGLFGWTKDETPRFAFFATEGRGSYWDGTQTVPLNPQGSFPNLTFDLFVLELGEREAFDDAVRYPSARTRKTLEDGFERVQPLVILETCQSAE